MNKDLLRKKYKIIRHNIIDKESQNMNIYNQIIHDENIINSKMILLYASLNDEVDTFNIINYFINNKIIALPKVNNDTMDFFIINSINDLKKGYFNILEPTSNNIVTDFNDSICIVPLICCDTNGNRIGYGKGYYDKFLSNKNIYTIGLSFKECVIDEFETENNDVKLNKIIYPK